MYRENKEFKYVYNLIDKDPYLKDLYYSIIKDDSILNNDVSILKEYSKKDIVNSLSFYSDINLKLHPILLKKDKKIKLENPNKINIIADYLHNSSEVYFNYDKKGREYVDSITLSFTKKRNSIISYLHEICHTQVTIYNNIQMLDDCHDEVLPIFIEQLAAKELGFDNYINFRLKELARDIYYYFNTLNNDDLYTYSTYIKSTLKALKLLDIYYNKPGIQKDIILGIQDIFDSNIKIEDLLGNYKITYENSKRKLRDLKHV